MPWQEPLHHDDTWFTPVESAALLRYIFPGYPDDEIVRAVPDLAWFRVELAQGRIK